MKTIGSSTNHRDRLRGYEVLEHPNFELELGQVVEFDFAERFPYREEYEGGVTIKLPGPYVWNRAEKDYLWEYNGPEIWVSDEVFDAATRRASWGRSGSGLKNEREEGLRTSRWTGRRRTVQSRGTLPVLMRGRACFRV